MNVRPDKFNGAECSLATDSSADPILIIHIIRPLKLH